MIEGHITEEMFKKFYEGTLGSQKTEELLLHLVSCEYCTEQFAVYGEKKTDCKAPDYLEEEILNRTKDTDFKMAVTLDQTVRQGARQISKAREMFYYSLKTLAAVTGSLVILVATMQMNVPQISKSIRSYSLSTQIQQKSDELAKSWENITIQLFQGGNK